MIKSTNNSILYFTPALGWGILICYFSLLPQQEVPQLLVSIKDYLLHFSIYAALGTLGIMGQNKVSRNAVSRSQLINVVVLCTALGVLLEVVQETLVPGRHFQWSDLLSNTLGVLIIIPINRYLLSKPH